MEQTDWLQPRKEPLRLPGAAPAMNPPSERMVSKATRSWLAFFTFGLLGKRKRAGTLVQAEMTLEKVQVIRNDLSDSDLELVVRKRKAPPVPEPPAEPAGSPGRDRQRWNERTARLFALSNP